MAADIFYGKGIIHVVPADVIFDHKDCGIFRLGILCVFKILCGFFFQRFVEFFISKSIVQSIYDEILFFVETGFHLILFASGGKYAEQLVIKITDLVGHKSKVSMLMISLKTYSLVWNHTCFQLKYWQLMRDLSSTLRQTVLSCPKS